MRRFVSGMGECYSIFGGKTVMMLRAEADVIGGGAEPRQLWYGFEVT